MNKLFVFSIDALQTNDLDYLKNKPNMSKILRQGLVVKNVKEIYPTLTYPIHTTIITGVYPKDHGIFHNQQPSINPEKPNWSIMGSDWYWYSDYIKAETLVDVANDAGLTTACIGWPVMGGQVPTHNLAEIWPNSDEPMSDTFKRACTDDMLKLYYDKYIKNFDWNNKTDVDKFMANITIETISRVKPDLMLMHYVELDHIRHEYGDEGIMIQLCLDEIDEFIGRVLDECKKVEITPNIVILGDHGQIDIHNRFNLNVLLAECGLIRVDEEGNVKDYDAYSFSAGFSTHIMLKNPDDHSMKEKVHRILKNIAGEYSEYIGRIFTKEEVLKEEGLNGDFSFVIEAADHVIFDNPVTGPVVYSNYEGYKGMHGHHPSKGPKPPFIVYGPSIKEHEEIQSATILDECPTLAKLLGLEMSGCVGNSLI